MDGVLRVELDLSALDLVYDGEADVLYISFSRDAWATDSVLADNDVVVRFRDGVVVGLTVLHFSERVKSGSSAASV
ncbi:hypothetical protein DRO48_04300 [Candidatus Bathyarchaeota archaeon]|nr:MAG: hypothetical protein DRO48_04300 [Candidatus Bathyarchaeota archaeon]